MRYVIIVELPKRELINECFKRLEIMEHTPFREDIGYKRRIKGSIEYTTVFCIRIIQDRKFSVKFWITKENFESSYFFPKIYEARNEAMFVKKISDSNSNYFHITIYSATHNSLLDILHGFLPLLENIKWYKHQDGKIIKMSC